jgi:hypothetical protein
MEVRRLTIGEADAYVAGMKGFPTPLAAGDFFALALRERTMQHAHLATRIAYSTIQKAAKGYVSPRVASELEKWSLPTALEDGAYISAVLTTGLSLELPSMAKLRAAAKRGYERVVVPDEHEP